MMELEFTVNGRPQKLSTPEDRTLLEILRESLGLTGTKYGCGEGACRACTVLVNGTAVQSCLTPARAVAGKKVETIEGLEQDGNLHPVQEAFIREEAMQCGFCVPGMIMSAVALLRKNSSPKREEIVTAMNGNLCRCCGYVNLLNAVEAAARNAGGRAK